MRLAKITGYYDCYKIDGMTNELERITQRYAARHVKERMAMSSVHCSTCNGLHPGNVDMPYGRSCAAAARSNRRVDQGWCVMSALCHRVSRVSRVRAALFRRPCQWYQLGRPVTAGCARTDWRSALFRSGSRCPSP